MYCLGKLSVCLPVYPSVHPTIQWTVQSEELDLLEKQTVVSVQIMTIERKPFVLLNLPGHFVPALHLGTSFSHF